MFSKIVKRYHRSFSLYGRRSPSKFNNYLRAHNVFVGEGVYFRYPKSVTIDVTRPTLIEIGNNVDINANFTIMTHDFGTFVFRNLYGDFVPSSGKVKIGNNIYIGRDVTILKGVEIGDNCIIGLGSVVTKKIPSNSVVAVCPAKVICDIDTYYRRRKEKQLAECIEYGVSIIERLGREPTINDFPEEWVNFLIDDDLKRYPEYETIVKFRLKDRFDDFINNNRPYFNGFDEFKEFLISTYANK